MSAEILIIDDNPDIRSILVELIEDVGFKTRVAANYNQALREIDKKLPDVAIIDVKLDKGDNDGIELLSHIKKKKKYIPLILMATLGSLIHSFYMKLCPNRQKIFFQGFNLNLFAHDILNNKLLKSIQISNLSNT